MVLPYLKKYFWEVDVSKLDFKKNPAYVIGRILEHGDVKAVRWLLKVFDKKTIEEVVLNHRKLKAKSANFWGLILKIDRSKILCLKKHCLKMQKTHWPY
jgi:hypothetical protein